MGVHTVDLTVSQKDLAAAGNAPFELRTEFESITDHACLSSVKVTSSLKKSDGQVYPPCAGI